MKNPDFEGALEELVDEFIINKHYSYKDQPLEMQLHHFSEFIQEKRRNSLYLNKMKDKLAGRVSVEV